jgi:uncharacterized membrane protein YhaH (DUF805 family)
VSLPASEYWFSLSIRRNRKSFLIGTLFLIGVLVAVLGGIYFFGVGKRTGIILTVIFGLPWIFVSYNLTAQRLRDFNLTGWLTLLWVPINLLQNDYAELSSALSLAFWIVLVFVPGTKGGNRYGSDPLEEF